MQNEVIELLTEFDELGMTPSTLVPDPEKTANEWKQKLVSIIQSFEWEFEKIFGSTHIKFDVEFAKGKLLDDIVMRGDCLGFCNFLNANQNMFEEILDYGDFCVFQCKNNHKYYYLEGGIEDAEDVFEVEVIAKLDYDVNHDVDERDVLCTLFSCSVCGEYVYDDGISYFWFNIKE